MRDLDRKTNPGLALAECCSKTRATLDQSWWSLTYHGTMLQSY